MMDCIPHTTTAPAHYFSLLSLGSHQNPRRTRPPLPALANASALAQQSAICNAGTSVHHASSNHLLMYFLLKSPHVCSHSLCAKFKTSRFCNLDVQFHLRARHTGTPPLIPDAPLFIVHNLPFYPLLLLLEANIESEKGKVEE